MNESTDEQIDDETDTDELLREVEKKRSLQGWTAVLVAVVGIAFSAFQLWLAARSFQFEFTVPLFGTVELFSLQLLQANAVHVAFAFVLTFFLFPTTKGTGPIAGQFARIVPAATAQFGSDSPIVSVLERLRAVVRWAAVDHDGDRVTPVDILFSGLIMLTPVYMITQFDEIRSMRVRGLTAGRPLQEIVPMTDPIVSAISAIGIPLDETSFAFVLAAIGVLLVLEATRRALGWLLTGLVTLFILYARWGYLIPRDSIIGSLSIPPTRWASIFRDLWFNTEAGVFGVPVTVSLRFIYIFILFGAFLEMSGAGKWFIDFAYSLTGSKRGGPAKSSVVASGFMGMLSGSSIANTVTTGAFTIPLMKRSGYSPSFSGAVESSASSGGQILPPVMGAAAFLIVEFTQTPYAEVIVAAAIPAIAFFFGMWVMVHLEAVEHDIGGVPKSSLSKPMDILKSGWFYLVPIGLLLYFLVIVRLSVARAGWYTIIALIALVAFLAAYTKRNRTILVGSILALFLAQFSLLTTTGVGIVGAIETLVSGGTVPGGVPPSAAIEGALGELGIFVVVVSLALLLVRPDSRSDVLELDDQVGESAQTGARLLGRPEMAANPAYRVVSFVLKSMDDGARTATTVVVSVAAAGIIPGVISVSGLGPNLTALILAVSGESLLGLLLLSGIAAIIFGMGMPTTVMYIILVSMLGTAIEEFGVALVAAHLFILYWGLMADVTPPVAVAAFAGAGVAKADEFTTAIKAFLLSLNKLLVPFAFVFSQGILLMRPTENGVRMMNLSDITDVGFILPEVIVPVVGLFAGVYALGVTIIGYQYAEVEGLERALFAIASVFLTVPELFLLPTEGLLGAFVAVDLSGFAVTFPVRIVGFAILAGLTVLNRRQYEGGDAGVPGASAA
ncbi:TRAP transporter permease [Halanaeroarchaeum sulfurireducens]|uniref:C4-dicarboxylate ABC transporter permease n=1 Tax=Halanaeroarchaeum sulfurireducens TaxID=1604004 RepID=A0A0F7P8P0_9EURY|nr:TRAP transporter fused permease subunit [Halanaeroarchaeum sulfurireducens]AKH97127.1 C4-dicarboxylate ABC transporter permease [Halanaeroarchaeum sulfurireducens]